MSNIRKSLNLRETTNNQLIHIMKRFQALAALIILFLTYLFAPETHNPAGKSPVLGTQSSEEAYLVTKVIDGDTIDVEINSQVTRIRLIGINTPETSDPRRPVQCFGREAKQYLTDLLENQHISLEADPTQSDRDQYNRLLRYAFLNGENINLQAIKLGYAYEYTYDQPYTFQKDFKQAQLEAQESKRGLWSPLTCDGDLNTNVSTPTPQPIPNPDCAIKGNVSSSGNLYHLPSCPDYNKTNISTDSGEQWFCNEQQAIQAGWKKAGNCP